MKNFLFILMSVAFMMLLGTRTIAQQNDTSSYFPLGFWGVWIDRDLPPFNPQSLTSIQWSSEKTNWTNSRGNYLIYFMPKWMENQIMGFCDTSLFRMDIQRNQYNDGGHYYGADSSVYDWIRNGTGSWASWTVEADNRIQKMYQLFGTHAGLYSYSLGHECPVVNYWSGCADSSLVAGYFWPRLEYVASRINQIDPNSNHRTYAVSGGAPSPGFTDNVPSLDILQCDIYPYLGSTPKTLAGQQGAIDWLLSQYNAAADRLRGKMAEWQAVIQSERDYVDAGDYHRRPTNEEFRVQAYLALSRGARGVTSFVYGSYPVRGGGTQSGNAFYPLLTGGASATQTFLGYDGLVDPNRNPFDQIHDNDPEHIPAFDNLKNLYLDLVTIGPTVRKLRLYNFFPAAIVPGSNSAKITTISTDYLGGNYVEAGTFKRMDQGTDSTDYFILVNRVLNNSDGTIANPQNVTVTFNRVSGSWEIEEVVSHKLWILPYNGSFTDVLSAGQGKLYKISPATWSGTKTLYFDTQVQAGATLTVLPGAIIKFGDLAPTLTVNGKLIAMGTPSSRICFTSGNLTQAPGDWGGIVCPGGGPDTLTYCDIKYAVTGLWLQNTAANSYMQNDTIRYSSSGGSGVTVSNTGTANRSLRMYKCGINTNDGVGLKVGNAKVSVSYSRIENNGLQWISYGASIYSGARVFFDSSRIQNNMGSGIKISGTGSRVLLTPDSSSTGYNTVYQHGVSELWLTSSGSAFLGGGYGPGNYGGYNNVYNTYNYNCRLINNGTSNLVSAKWTYWGSTGTRFCGPVDSSLWLGSPVNTPSVMQYHDPGDEPMSLSGSSATLSEWLVQLKSDIANNNENAFDALHHLANFSGPGGGYQGVLGMSWENFLSTVINKSTVPNVKSLAIAFLVQSSLDKGDFAQAVTSADDQLSKKIDEDLRFFLQTRKIYAEVGRGNISSAKEMLSEIQSTASLSDTDAVKAMTEYVLLAAKSAQGSGTPGYFVKNLIFQHQAPNRYILSQNFPNPFNPTTSFRYKIAMTGHVSLKIYDVLGREVALIVDEEKDPGEYNVAWDASSCSSGVYFFKLQAGTFTDVKKMLLVR